MKESSHWYDRTGEAVFEVPNKSKPGKRPTTLRDARTLQLLPSVTTVMSVLAKPQLDDWKHRQITAWCYNHTPHNEDAEAFHARAIEGAFEQVSDAADLGTDIHKALELYFTGQPYDAAFKVYVEPVVAWVEANGVKFHKHELRLTSTAFGYAGTTDAVIECSRGAGILDFKSRKTKPGLPVTPFDGQAMQIAAYYKAAWWDETKPPLLPAVGVNVFISTTEPGRVEAAWYDADQIAREWEAFKAALTLWRHLKGYDPRLIL